MEACGEQSTGSSMKPFSAQKAREIVLNLNRPAVFLGMANDWPASRWNVPHLCDLLQDKSLRFRIGRREMSTEPQFETQCDYIDGTIGQFRAWVSGGPPEDCGPFSPFSRAEFWAYADYKYLALLFEDEPQILQDVLWEDFGFPGRGGQESTLWVGSRGANTPCHIDSYGCNLVLQVEGRKRWRLFPPEDTPHLYPTRIPYEESSIFSKVHVLNPDRKRYPSFCRARPHVVTLHPGQVLLVPRHWWHYVESIDDVTVSINSWMELDSDDEARVEEAITRMVVCAFKSADPASSASDWLNPTENMATSHNTNLEYLNRATSAYRKRRRTAGESDPSIAEQEPPPVKKSRSERSLEGDSDWFGPHLLPVLPVSSNVKARGDEDTAVMADAQTENGDPNPNPATEWTDTITSNAVLDCLVNPQVIRLVAGLLLSRSNT
ncbi:HSPB1-associated protein 1 isoform X2 [Hyperolius riggenbachi]|uniref:HSPB1-associated protein 1 isoform X2 n=1 Tax=Hyperolius riggenbachi TaxID=752182 RepID=UPI0035A39FD5